MYCQPAPRQDEKSANAGVDGEVCWVVRESISSQRETVDVAGLFGLIDPDEEEISVREQMRLDSGAESTTFLKWVMGLKKKRKDTEYMRSGIEGSLASLSSIAKQNNPKAIASLSELTVARVSRYRTPRPPGYASMTWTRVGESK